MSNFKTLGIAKVLGTKSLSAIDKKVTEGLLAIDATSREIETETKFLVAGLGVSAFAEEISTAASVFGITVAPTIIQTVGNVLTVGSALSMANKAIDNFNEIDISGMNVEEVMKLLEVDEEEYKDIEKLENVPTNKEL